MNIDLSILILTKLYEIGLREVCLCAGSRNSPLVSVLSKAQGIQIYNFFDERSAAFFACGRMQATQRPMAVVTTSGTAVAELLPACVEATYSGLPLIVITADRPKSYWGTGAPQTIEQVGIFSGYVEKTYEIENIHSEIFLYEWTQKKPIQLNVCFDEPLLDKEIPAVNFSTVVVQAPIRNQLKSEKPDLSLFKKPIVVVGPLEKRNRARVLKFLEVSKLPVYAEVLSGLRGEKALSSQLIRSGEKFISSAFQKGDLDSVIRLGNVPTLRLWRDLESSLKNTPLLSVSELPFSGVSRTSQHFSNYAALEALRFEFDGHAAIIEKDRANFAKMQGLVKKYPRAEVSLISSLTQIMSEQTLYLGNSLPIREFDLIADPNKPFKNVHGNRGANGIDGQISTFLGACEPGQEAWCVVGDLTAMYDLSSLWITGQAVQNPKRIVIINNGGGQIFKSIYKNDLFVNKHNFEFSHFAKMWKWDYQLWMDIPANPQLTNETLIELRPEATQSDLFWKEYNQL